MATVDIRAELEYASLRTKDAEISVQCNIVYYISRPLEIDLEIEYQPENVIRRSISRDILLYGCLSRTGTADIIVQPVGECIEITLSSSYQLLRVILKTSEVANFLRETCYLVAFGREVIVVPDNISEITDPLG